MKKDINYTNSFVYNRKMRRRERVRVSFVLKTHAMSKTVDILSFHNTYARQTGRFSTGFKA